MPASDAAPADPRADPLPTIESTGGRSGFLTAFDGLRLRFAHWPAPTPPARGGVMVLPGRTEFIEKYLETVEDLRARGLAVWIIDWRGQGGSARMLSERHRGHVRDFADYAQDLQLFAVAHLRNWDQGPLMLLAHSMGGNIGLRFLHDHPGLFSRAVFSAPMTGIRRVGLPVRALAEAACALGLGDNYVPGGRAYGPGDLRFAGNPLTSDEARFGRFHAFIERDPALAIGAPTLGWLRAALRACAALAEPAIGGALATPSLFVCGGDDRVVDNACTVRLAARMPDARVETVPGCRHEILVERDPLRKRFWTLFDGFTGMTPA